MNTDINNEEIKRIVSSLKSVNTELVVEANDSISNLTDINNGWHDTNSNTSIEKMKKTMSSLTDLCRDINDLCNFLNKYDISYEQLDDELFEDLRRGDSDER